MISNVFDYSEFESSSEISKLLDASRHGDATAQFKLGVRYVSGDGVRKSIEEAVKWVRKAAENGHAEAQHKLGQWYNLGIGVTKNPSAAVKWWLKSAVQGYAPAQYDIGASYGNGYAVQRNDREAAMWFRKAAASATRAGATIHGRSPHLTEESGRQSATAASAAAPPRQRW